MDLNTWLELQRGRVVASVVLDQDIRRHRWTHAPERLDEGEWRPADVYKTHWPYGHKPIKLGYLRNRLIYDDHE